MVNVVSAEKNDKDTEILFEGNSIILQYNNNGILVETMITKVNFCKGLLTKQKLCLLKVKNETNLS